MNDESNKYYELLGVAPGTSGRELKQAYLDMAKVWHPDRFSHDPRLQQKAQEKLKEINDAYERLSTGKAARGARPKPPPGEPRATAAAAATGGRAKVMLPAAFCAAFVVALYALTQSGAPQTAPQTSAGQVRSTVKERERPDTGTAPSANQPARGNERAGRRPAAEATDGVKPAAEPGAPTARAMPTATVNIDSASGMLATKDCPVVSRMTYPAGAEPQQHCTVQHNPKGSRMKSVAKRMVSPAGWLGDGKGAPNDEARDVLRPGGDRP